MKSIDLKLILAQEGDLGKVIHTQIQIEHLIDEYIKCSLRQPEFLKHIGLDYFGKVHLALASGLPAELKAPLTVLGKLRNDFAHKLNTQIDSSRINNFYKSFPSSQREKFMTYSKATNQSWIMDDIPWSKVEPSLKFQHLCIALFYWCKTSIDVLKIENEQRKLGSIALRQLDI